jgi:hypothetical protein
MKALDIVSTVIDRLQQEGWYYSDETQTKMDEALEIVAEELGIEQYKFEIELAMHEGGYSTYEEAEEFVGANGLWDCIEPLASFQTIWERLIVKRELNKVMRDNFFVPNTRGILTAVIDKSNQLILNDF